MRLFASTLTRGLVFAALAATAFAQTKTAPVTTDLGKVAGTVLDSGVHAYIGIPFAAPPVGNLRWHEPMPAKSWSGVYDATTPKPACTQRSGNNPANAETYSEDCLYLNVWTPADAKPGAKLPVIVYIYGGGFSGGSANIPGYSGQFLARKGIIQVNLAYRVGVFGYFAHPELTKETGHNASGDWGSLDQVAGLKWVQRNIAAFGGDPANVLLMGHSAGSESVYQLVVSPMGKGLFKKVSGWSGADLAPGGQIPKTLAEGEATGLKVQQMLGAKDLAAMRSMTADQIMQALATAPGAQAGPGGGIQTRPIIDGWFLPAAPHEIFMAHKQNDVALLASSTANDLGAAAGFWDNGKTVADLKRLAAQDFGDAAPEVLKLFPAATDEEARKDAVLISGYAGFGIANRDWARDQALYGKQPAYLVHWAHVPPPNKPGVQGGGGMGNGPSHGSDIAYWLGTYQTNNNKVWSDWDKELSEKMQNILIAFAKTGNPSTEAVKVPRYDPKSEQRVIFGETISIDKMNTEQIEFLRAHAPKRAPMGAPAAPATPAAAGGR
jgi:para-nitrobenzyl esterase